MSPTIGSLLQLDQRACLASVLGDKVLNVNILGISLENGMSRDILQDIIEMAELRWAFGSNNFSGSLPPELGNLVKLEQIYIDSARVSGEIPSTFAKLQNMQTLSASDNLFTGKIPDFIGNWTKLSTLRLQGNSFEGPIPSSFSTLTSMNDLRISELSNVSSSLDFIQNMKNLSSLVLRNSIISGIIPSDIGEYQSLQTLKFSFMGDTRFTMSKGETTRSEAVGLEEVPLGEELEVQGREQPPLPAGPSPILPEAPAEPPSAAVGDTRDDAVSVEVVEA
ncbi:hypothetical protein HHK36_004738 [Tetracentron sinense]|uniref:Uncharacterized protein n=1 Tax=Tetracentron sinense TaxID=13715 RepID=A0A834ZN53_TETSI|nr:hypothetical protein HHK36_004738 [Tetracentron sinense]